MAISSRRLECDILVAGGGAAGVPCALAAARSGARVILCQDRPVLGGNASSEVRMHIVGANGTGSFDRGQAELTEAREGGIIEEIRLDNCVRNPQRSAAMFDLILYDKCRCEPRLQLLLNTTVVGVERDGARIRTARAERPSTEERFEIAAKLFIDCTGDGRLGVEAGSSFLEGRESTAQFGEQLAQPTADRYRLGSTILLQARRHERPMPFVPPGWVRTFTADELRLRLYAMPGHEAPTHEYGYWWAEWGGTLDTIRDNETIRDELLAITLGIWNHVKNGPPGTPPGADPFQAACWALEWIGFLPGKRESRRFLGQYLLTEQDLLASRSFPDAIAYGGWSLDLHPPQGIDAPDQEPCEQHPVPWLYDIPLRACVSRDVPNLLFAGRNLSATHVAFASTRVMATCAVVGQGVGTAAAYAVRHEIPVQQLAERPADLQAIQQQLLREDVYLVGIRAEDAADVAPTATIRASSELPGGEAKQVVSGWTRSVHGPRGAPPGRNHPGTHRWLSDPRDGLPAWLELEWPQAVAVGSVELVFDTGMHRHLTLSHHDGYTSRMEWGHPQPETVADYRLEVELPTGWHLVHAEVDNYQRLRRHRFPEDLPAVRRLRIVVLRTHGVAQVRLCAVRVYGRE